MLSGTPLPISCDRRVVISLCWDDLNFEGRIGIAASARLLFCQCQCHSDSRIRCSSS